MAEEDDIRKTFTSSNKGLRPNKWHCLPGDLGVYSLGRRVGHEVLSCLSNSLFLVGLD